MAHLRIYKEKAMPPAPVADAMYLLQTGSGKFTIRVTDSLANPHVLEHPATSTPADGSVTTSKIADNAITSAKIAATAVQTQHISDGAVTNPKIATGAVSTAKLTDHAVTTQKLAAGAVNTSILADGSVAESKLANNSVSTAKLQDSAVQTAKIADRAVTTPKLQDSAVTEAKIADAAVSYTKLMDGAVITSKLGNQAVTTAKIAPKAVTVSLIADQAVTSAKLAPGAVNFTLVRNPNDNVIKSNASPDLTVPVADQNHAGLMSAADKAKIDGLTGRGFSLATAGSWAEADVKAIAADMEAGTFEGYGPLISDDNMVTAKPIIAAVHGHCIGEGVNLMLACDLVVADETVKVAVSEARIGINAVDIPLKLARKLGYAKAFALLAPGDAKDAAWCQAAGLVEIITPAGQAQSRAFELATEIAQSCAPLAVQAQKETLWRAVFEDEAAGRRAGMNWRELTRSSRDYAEGQTAFIERRKPIFTGK